VVGSSFKGNGKDVKLISDDFYFILERRLSKSKNDDGSEVWLAIDEEALQSRLKSSQHGREALLQHHRFVLKFTRNRPDLLIFHDNEFHLLETIQYRLPYSKSLPLVRGVVAADTCFTPDIDAQTGERDESDIIPNKAFIVLRYIAGDTFTDLSKTWSQSDRFDKTHASLASLEQAFDELSRADIVHRDISPNNLMQDRHGGVHIIDFGFAADLQAETPTKLGEGTIKYRAPEIIEEAQADTRTDQFSLACVFYFLLTGRSPSHGPSGELIDEFNENLPSTLAEVLTQAISENKNERYTDFASFFSALKQAFKQDIQARDELRPLQLNIDGWFEYQTGIQQTIKDYQQLQQSLLAPNTQLQVLKAAGLIGQDKLNILLSYEGIDVNIEKHIKTLQGQDSTADKHLKALKHTLNQLKQGESAAVPSLTNPPKVKQSDYLKLKSQVDDEVEAFNDLLAGIGEQMIGQVEQHSQWPDEALNGEINIVEHIISELNQQKNTFTKQFSKAKKANEKQNHVLSQLNQFISELNQGALQSKNKLTPINDGLLTNKAHLIASITERLESEQRIKALISEYQQFIEQCQTFNQTGKQAAEQLRLLNNNQKSTQGYWQKQWNEASESKVLSTNLLLILLVSIIAGVVYWSPFKQENNKISLVKHTPGIVQLKLDEALQEGRYQLSTKDSAVACKYNAYRSRALSNNQVEGETYFICRGLIAGEHQYTLGSPTKGIIKTGIISITPPVHKFAITTKPVEAIATLETSHKDIKYQEQFKAGEDVPEGKYQLKITAKDYHDKVELIEWRGQALSIELEAIDKEPPTIELTDIKQTGESLSLTINVKDNKALKQLNVKVMQGDKEIEGSAKVWLLDRQTEASIDWVYNFKGLEGDVKKVKFSLEDMVINYIELEHEITNNIYEVDDIDSKNLSVYIARGADGDALSLNKLGYMYLIGLGVSADSGKAFKYYNKAVELGDQEAMVGLAYMYGHGKGVSPSYKNAMKYYRLAADKGHPHAQYRLAREYEQGKKGGDLNEAINLYKKAALKGHASALYYLGSIYSRPENELYDIKKSIEYYEKAAALNHYTESNWSTALGSLTHMFQYGKGVNASNKTRIQYINEALNRKDVAGYEAAGDYYYYRDNNTKAIHLWEKAAELGSERSTNRLIYLYGKMRKENGNDNFENFEPKEDLRKPDQLFNIGYRFHFGKGVVPDIDKAISYYQRAAESGSARALNILGGIYEYHPKVIQNYGKAIKYFNDSKKLGYELASLNLVRLNSINKWQALDIHPPLFPLVVNTNPINAKVKITNIHPKYEQGLLLAAGEYVLEILKSGYKSERKTIYLYENNSAFNFTLQPTNRKLSFLEKESINDPMNRNVELIYKTEGAEGVGKYQKSWAKKLTGKSKTLIQRNIGAAFFNMVFIPKGKFKWGCSSLNINNCDSDEFVNRQSREGTIDATITKGFWLAESETTWQLYNECVKDSVCQRIRDTVADKPIVGLGYEYITSYFIPWLNRKDIEKGGDGKYRLPTEVEWEFAAKGGVSLTDFSWGNKIDCTKAVYERLYDSHNCAGKEPIVNVKNYSSNNFGLFDMEGNVWEFVSDCWHDSYKNAPLTNNNSKGWGAEDAGDCSRGVRRGGSFADSANSLRLTNRISQNKTSVLQNTGFRLVQDLP